MQQKLLPYTCLVGILMVLFAVDAFANSPGEVDPERDPWSCFTDYVQDRFVIKIRGRVLETHSGKPLKKASIVFKVGDEIIASRLTSIDGFFSVDIAKSKMMDKQLDLSIEFMDHIFLQNDLDIASQDMLININSEVLLDDDPIADYKLPIHTLNNPKVGKIDIRIRQNGARVTVDAEEI